MKLGETNELQVNYYNRWIGDKGNCQRGNTQKGNMNKISWIYRKIQTSAKKKRGDYEFGDEW